MLTLTRENAKHMTDKVFTTEDMDAFEAEIRNVVDKAVRQDREFQSSVLRNLPNLPADIKLGWTNNPSGLAKVLREALLPRFDDGDLRSQMAKTLFERFNKVIEVPPLPSICTEENLARWATFNLKPVFLPNEEIGQRRQLVDWVKPQDWFYTKIHEGKIASDSANLFGNWVLADFTKSVDYTDGTQVYPNDPLAPIIYQLRREQKIGKHDKTPVGSRFSITNNEWRNILCPAIAEELGIPQVRLERAIEFNTIGNLYDDNRGKFNSWEWFEDAFGGSNRLSGGRRGGGGLADVDYDGAGSRDDDIAGRPLGVLS